MSECKFKIGDKVIFMGGGGRLEEYFTTGEEYTVHSTDYFTAIKSDSYVCNIYPSEFEYFKLVEKSEYITDLSELVVGEKYDFSEITAFSSGLLFLCEFRKYYLFCTESEDGHLKHLTRFRGSQLIAKIKKYTTPRKDPIVETRDVEEYFVYSDKPIDDPIGSALDKITGKFTHPRSNIFHGISVARKYTGHGYDKIGKITSVTIEYDIKEDE